MEGDLTMTANWHPDPTGEHELRYWDGRMWTEHVADQGVQSVSPLPTVAPAGTTTEADLAAAHAEQQRATQETVTQEDDAPGSAEETMVDAADDPEPAVDDEPTTSGEGVAMIHQPVIEPEQVEDAPDDAEQISHESAVSEPVAVAEPVEHQEPEGQDLPADETEPGSSFGPEASFSTIGGADAYEDEPIRNPLTAGPVEDAPGADPLPDEVDEVDGLVDEIDIDAPAGGIDAPVDDIESGFEVEQPAAVDEQTAGTDEQAAVDATEPVGDDAIVPEAEDVLAEAAPDSGAIQDEPAPVDVAPEVVAAVVPPVVEEPAVQAPTVESVPAQTETPVAAGISGDLIDGRFSEVDGAGAALQNSRLLRVRVGEAFMARQGAMVAYQGEVTFAYQGGGASKFLKKAVTGEGLSLMRVEGNGDVFLADTAKHVHILHLTESGISVNGANVLAFSASLEWNVERVKGGSIAAGGLFNTTLRGTGWVAVTTDGEPVVLNAGEAPTFADTNAVVAWSADLQTSLKTSMSAGALIGRGSGEAIQVAFAGQGFVIVQPSEGYPAPTS